MKVAFLCGSLAAGVDGVGDYTRRLADELTRQGHSATAVALRDVHVSEPVVETMRTETDPTILLRIPARLPWPQRIEMARRHLDEFCPDWVSVQFVCYGYHPKGLVCGLAEKLSPLFTGRKVHIMFHEIWLCKELGWGWRKRAVGALQQFFIRRFVGVVKPNVMHTSNATYAALLSRSGIPASELQLFGNVPVLEPSPSEWIKSRLRDVLGSGYRREDFWFFGIFGALHRQWPPEPLLTCLSQAAERAGKRPVLLSIGRIGHAGLELWNDISRNYASHFTFVHLGEQPAELISEFLSSLDWGIATTPRSILGKSGTVISMLEHGLPVIVNRNETLWNEGPKPVSDPLLIACDAELEKNLKPRIDKHPCRSRRPQVARMFLSSLAQATAVDRQML
jgi:hypothetical protein